MYGRLPEYLIFEEIWKNCARVYQILFLLFLVPKYEAKACMQAMYHTRISARTGHYIHVHASTKYQTAC